MGGSAFNVPCTLVKNGYTFNTSSLTDSRVNAFLLINKTLADQLIQRCVITVYFFDQLIPVNGFNGQLGKLITS
jgi:hypothetical protein